MNLPRQSRAWCRELAMGLRFACGGGPESWIRTLFTGVGVGLGVTLLLVTAALPGALTARTDRGDARLGVALGTLDRPGPDTVLLARTYQDYRGKVIEGSLLKAEGPRAPAPPGLAKIPGPGQLAVSPALADLLAAPEGRLLRERLSGEITGLIGDAGLLGPGELYFYAGHGDLEKLPGERLTRTDRFNAFGGDAEPDALDPVLTLLVALTFVALLMPVVVFLAAAVRFGAERRDRRLAALRLVGADTRAVRRIAAGEALAGALIGLVLGAGFFLVSRRLVGSVALGERSVFPADLDPSGAAVALVAVAVPLAAVAVTLFGLRGVLIEPLGVVRTARPPGRRVWWRLLPPAGGLLLLAPVVATGGGGPFDEVTVSVATVLLLCGVTALLPWLLERTAAALSGGPVSWQLAVRRLQVSSGAAARLVSGIAVAVAGAIALQLLFTATESTYTGATGEDPGRAALSVTAHGRHEPGEVEELSRRIARSPGVAGATALTDYDAALTLPPQDEELIRLTVGTCEALREVARLDTCRDGDAFVLAGPSESPGRHRGSAAPGQELYVGGVLGYDFQSAPVRWSVPAGARTAASRPDPVGHLRTGLLATPSAAPPGVAVDASRTVFVRIDPALPDALEQARAAVFRADPTATAATLVPTRQDPRFGAVRGGLFAGATLVLVLIGLSLLVAQSEQLHERRKLLAALGAFGVPRRTLCLSVLWQTALPVGVAMVLATVTGLALGWVLLRLTGMPAGVSWGPVLGLAGAGAGVIALVTLLSLPPLLRMTRPEGLRTE
ncbi:FtsX-like permease family protein [Streptomyces sp. NPDC091268]|uniref:FtsX-like permease family protein n=1 Tax=Streptomyces sp. NPDC091268 TaxID=3365979 RepID=UPI00382F6104